DMAVGKKRALAAHHGRHAAALGAWVHGYAFADQAVAAHLQRRRLALVLEVLRLMADRCKGKDARSGANGGAPGNDGMAHQLTFSCERALLRDVTEGSAGLPLAEVASHLEDCGGVALSFLHHPDPGSWRCLPSRPQPDH